MKDYCLTTHTHTHTLIYKYIYSLSKIMQLSHLNDVKLVHLLFSCIQTNNT